MLRDYIKRAQKGEGPTLAEDPRTAYLKQTHAFSATYYPVDPTYLADWAKQVLGFADPMESADSKAFSDGIDKLSAEWKKLPASAIRSEMRVDDDGLVMEGSVPPPVMRMFGDALRAGIETFQKKQAAKGADPIDPAQMP